jgi:transcriptional regulator with XRE-family HTH domain
MSLIDELRKAIVKSGESQLSIAKATGVDHGNLNSFLHGKRGLSLETAAKLADYLKLKLVRR